MAMECRIRAPLYRQHKTSIWVYTNDHTGYDGWKEDKNEPLNERQLAKRRIEKYLFRFIEVLVVLSCSIGFVSDILAPLVDTVGTEILLTGSVFGTFFIITFCEIYIYLNCSVDEVEQERRRQGEFLIRPDETVRVNVISVTYVHRKDVIEYLFTVGLIVRFVNDTLLSIQNTNLSPVLMKFGDVVYPKGEIV